MPRVGRYVATSPLPPIRPPPASPLHAPLAGGEWLFGRYRLVTATRRLHAGERSTSLDARACAVLLCLLRHAEHVVPRATLIGETWPDADTVLDSAVSKVMRRLRTAMGDHSGHVLQTVYGEGYRLALPAVLLPAPAEHASEDAAGQSQSQSTMVDPRPPPSWEPRRPPPLPLAWLPWAIATLATLAAISLAWLLLRSASAT